MNFPPETVNLLKFSAQDSDLEYLCWRRKIFLVSSDLKPPLFVSYGVVFHNIILDRVSHTISSTVVQKMIHPISEKILIVRYLTHILCIISQKSGFTVLCWLSMHFWLLYILFVVIYLFEFNGIIARRNYVFKNLLRGGIFHFLSCRSDWGHTIKHTLSRMVTH